MAELEDGDPFKEFGGSVITKTEEEKDPFAQFGGKELKKKIKSDTGGQPSRVGSNNPMGWADQAQPSGFDFSKQSAPNRSGYDQWKSTLPKRLQSEEDYDLKGYYNKYGASKVKGEAHLTDEFKLPNHPTFSNESVYFNDKTKNKAGEWQGDVYVPFDPNRDAFDEKNNRYIKNPRQPTIQQPSQAPVEVPKESYLNLVPQMLQEIPKSVYNTLGNVLKTEINQLSKKPKEQLSNNEKGSLAKQYLDKVFGGFADLSLEDINPATAFNSLLDKITKSSIPKESKDHAIQELSKASNWMQDRTNQLNQWQQQNPVPENLGTSVAKGISGMIPDIALASLGGGTKGAVAEKYVAGLTEKAPAVIAKYAPKAAALLERTITAPFTKVMALKGAAEGGAQDAENPTLGIIEGGLKGAGEGMYMHVLGEAASKVSPYIAKVIGKTGATSELSTAIANPLATAGTFTAAKAVRTPIEEGRMATEEELAHEAAMGLGFSLLHAASTYNTHAEANKFYDNVLKTDPQAALGRVLNENPENVKDNYDPNLKVKDLESARDEIKSAILKEPDLEVKKQLGDEAIKIQNQLDAKETIEGLVKGGESVKEMIDKLPELSPDQKDTYINRVAEIQQEYEPTEMKKNALSERISQAEQLAQQHEELAKNASNPVERTTNEVIAKQYATQAEEANKELTKTVTEQLNPKEPSPTVKEENIPIEDVTEVSVGDKVVMDNGKTGEVTIQDGKNVTVKFDEGGVITTSDPSVIGMNKLPTVDVVKEEVKVKPSVVEEQIVPKEEVIDITEPEVIPKLKEETIDAIPEQSPSGILQSPQEGLGEKGSERRGVEQGEQGKETTGESKTKEEVKKESLEELSSYVPNSGEVKKYLSGETIEKYEGESPTNNQEYIKQELMPALAHGIKIIDAAKERFGDDFVSKTLDFIENGKENVESKALMYVSLENELAKQKINDPARELEIGKQQDLVRAKSQAYLRKNAIEINMGRLRKIAEAGYDINKVTSTFFSTEQNRSKQKIEKSLQADSEAINKEAERIEKESEGLVSENVQEAIAKGVEAQINEIYKKLPTERRKRADKAIEALTKIQKNLRSKTYEGTIGLPVAILDAGISTIKAAIKAGVNIADAIELGINKIKEKHENWVKEDEFRKDMLKGFKDEGIPTDKGDRIKTPQERLADAKGRTKQRIDDIREQIIDKKRELDARGVKVKKDAELTRLEAELESITKLRDKYLPKEENTFTDEKKASSASKKLLNEIANINEQINKGEKKEREASKDPYENEELNKLKAEKKARLDMLELIDPTPKEFVKNALIDAGYGREINVTTKEGKETRQILDWKKLAGEEGSVTRIQENVEKALKDKGYSDADILRLQDAFVSEYNNLRASIVEKSLKELESRNTPKEPVDTKSSAQRLSELYNYGLFDKANDTYDYLMNKALGMNTSSQETFFRAKELAKALSDLYNQKPQGEKLSELALQPAINNINHQLSMLLSKIAFQESNWKYKTAMITQQYMSLAQRALLTSLKQLQENIMSGFVERAFSKLTFMNEKTDTPALKEKRIKIAQDMIKDITLNAGLDYGNVNNPFLSKNVVESIVNAKSKDQAYHAVVSFALGRLYLEGADSMHKVVLTENLFQRQLVKVLTNPNNPTGFKTTQEAINYVSEQLTGQTYSDAQKSAKEVIDNVNAKAGKKILPDNENAVNRLANSIVKDALAAGGKMTTAEVEASFNSAYTVAGFGMGHEANNPISRGVGQLNTHVEGQLKEAIKEKKWDQAALLTFESIIVKNILNPFVGGGTNWVTLTLQKAGLDWYSPLKDVTMKKSNPIDLTSPEGLKNLEKSLLYDAKAKSTQGRVFIGAVAGLLTYAAVKSSGKEDDIDEWIKKNDYLKKYFNVLSPQALILMLALKNGEMKKYFQGLLNVRTDIFSDGVKFTQGAADLIEGITDKDEAKKNKGLGKLGDVIGGKMSLPSIPYPYKFTRDVQNLYLGITGRDQIKPDFTSSGFANGFYRTGMIEFLGLRPAPAIEKPLTPKQVNEKIKEAMDGLRKKQGDKKNK